MRLGDLDDLKESIAAMEYLSKTDLDFVYKAIDNAPTVRLEYLPNYANLESVEMIRISRPQGEWIAVSSMIDKDIHIICSNCKEEFIGKSTLEEWAKEYLFCHRCGAKMKGGAE